MNPIPFNFPMPADYRRDFYLEHDGCKCKLEFRGNTSQYTEVGKVKSKAGNSRILDWIFDCTIQVRHEFGQD